MSETKDNLNLTLRTLYPICWVLQKVSLDAFLSNYKKLLDCVCNTFNSTDTDAQLKYQAQLYFLSLERYEVYFYLQIMQLLLHNFHAAHVATQSHSLSMPIAKQLASSQMCCILKVLVIKMPQIFISK